MLGVVYVYNVVCVSRICALVAAVTFGPVAILVTVTVNAVVFKVGGITALASAPVLRFVELNA